MKVKLEANEAYESIFDVIQTEGKADEYKCKECDWIFSVLGSVKRHVKAKHRRKESGIKATESSRDELEELDPVDEFEFDPDTDETPQSTQNGHKSLSAEEILKIYEDKEMPDEESANVNDNEQTLFPEKEVMLQLITTTEQEENEQANNDDVVLDEDDNIEKLKDELTKMKEVLQLKDKILQEKDDLIMVKQIEITTFKDEVETL